MAYRRRNVVLRNRLVKILSEHGKPMTIEEIKTALRQMDYDINLKCNKNHRVGYTFPSSNKLSQTMAKDLRFWVVGKTGNGGSKHPTYSLWALKPAWKSIQNEMMNPKTKNTGFRMRGDK
tara:strand:+ start:282 stop:641 length:360 start_codon:yes stop_codon:yes gene_type:complete